MSVLRANSRPRASADLGYRLFAGVVVASAVELIGVNLARDRDPQCPNYLVPTLVAVGAGVAMAVFDPPYVTDTPGSGYQSYSLRSAGGRKQTPYTVTGFYMSASGARASLAPQTFIRKAEAIRRAKELARQYNTSIAIEMQDEYGYHDWTVEPSGEVVEM